MQISFVGFQPVQSSEHMAVINSVVIFEIFLLITIYLSHVVSIIRLLVHLVYAKFMLLWNIYASGCRKTISRFYSKIWLFLP